MSAAGRGGRPPRGPPPAFPPAPPWMLGQRVVVPGPPDGYCDRPALTARCTPTRRSLTVLSAPGGFGKTTVLAAACRAAAAGGAPVAWLALADDDAATLDAYLALSFQRAGLDVRAALREHGPAAGSAHPRTALLLNAVEARGRPFVLALDELENLADPDAVAVLDSLLRNPPACLHVALAYRRLPTALAAARHVLDRAEIVAADDLRFSRGEIARFFGFGLSRAQLAAADDESGGWAIALRVRRNAAGPSAAAAPVVRDAVGSWIAARFWRTFAVADRRLALDLCLFDWFDRDLLDEVLGSPGAFERATRLPGLAGLLQHAANGSGSVRLHPLLREHGAEAVRREFPDRGGRMHRRIATALARRGATVAAMRHAAEGGDAQLAGTILLDAGGLEWWLREGAVRLAAADRLIADHALADRPRLACFRSVACLLQGRLAAANRVFAEAARERPAEPGLEVDRLIARGMLELNGARAATPQEAAAGHAEAARIAARPATSPLVRGAILYGHASHHGLFARFDAAVDGARRARDLLVRRSAYLTMHADQLLGEVAMARGHVREARRRYRNAERISRDLFIDNPEMSALADLMARELALERNRACRGDHLRTARAVFRGGYHWTRYAVAAELAVATETEAGGTGAGIAAVDDLAGRARDAAIAPPLLAFLAAHRAGLLADAGRTGDAQRTWRDAALPATDAGCLDIDAQSWRAMEAVACARIRLLAALGRMREARALERALAGAAAGLGLRRTLMRALALRVRLAHDDADPGAAQAAAAEYVRLFAATDYARPLLCARAAAESALGRVLRADPGGPLAAPARRLLGMVPAAAAPVPALDGRETAVLRLLGTRQDKEIAAALGLSRDGVRYHVRKIFAKLGVRRRRDAVRRATALGVLPAKGPHDGAESGRGPGREP